jgi:hypothetical protein
MSDQHALRTRNTLLASNASQRPIERAQLRASSSDVENAEGDDTATTVQLSA